MQGNKLYHGDFQHVEDCKLNSVRVFISSTFSDTTQERNGLIEQVYPRLREYCLTKYNIQFQYSDMRWGIPSTGSNTHDTVDMCLQELDSCCRLSMATNCVILLSHRYGSRLIPASLTSRIFNLLKNSVSLNQDEQNVLLNMYQVDENYLEQKYFLRSIDNIEQWKSIENKLQIILRKAADHCYKQNQITREERNEFFISVTAQEIYRALKNNTNSTRRVICFFRDISDLEELGSKYRETENIDEIEHLLGEIKASIENKIDSSDIYKYKVKWNDENDRNRYLTQFYNDFYHAVQTQIDIHMKFHKQTQNDVLYNQILEQAIQCNLLLKRYYPRSHILGQIKEYVMSITYNPCLLYGESGTGKSSIMAILVNEIRKWYSKDDSISIIIRFLGATPSTSDIRRPLISIIEQICYLYGLSIPLNFDNVKETFEDILQKVPTNKKLVILLDSIDQIQIADIKKLSLWLPNRFLSSNIKLIMSTIPSIQYQIENIDIKKMIKMIYEKNNLFEIEVEKLDKTIAEQVLHFWLERDQRCLTSAQYECLKTKIESCIFLTPLFLSLVYDQTLRWHSFDTTIDKNFLNIRRTVDAIEHLFSQLGRKHGKTLFERSMMYLQISGGLSQSEIEDILSADDEVLKSVFVHYLPPFNLFRLPSTLWIRIRNDMHKYLIEKTIDNIPCIYFYHQSFQYYQPLDVRKLISQNQTKTLLDKNRLEYFSNQFKTTFDMSYSPKLAEKYKLSTMVISVNRYLTEQKPFRQKNKQYNYRRLHQLYININRYDFAHPFTLYNYEFLSTYLRCGEYKMSDLLYEFSIGALDPNGELRHLLEKIELSAPIIDLYPKNLSFEFIFYLFPYIKQLPELTYNLLVQCINRCPLRMITDQQRFPSLTLKLSSNIQYITINIHTLFVLTDHNELYLFSWYYYGYFKIGHFKIEYERVEDDERLISLVSEYPYICFQSSSFSLIILNRSKADKILHLKSSRIVSFINTDTILITSLSNNAIELWNCERNVMVGSYKFLDDLIKECYLNKSIIAVTFTNTETVSYLSIDENYQIKSFRILNESINNHQNHINIDHNFELFYSFNRTQASLIIYHENNTRDIIHTIDFHTIPKSVVYLSKSKSVAWISTKSVILFHPLYTKQEYRPFQLTSIENTIEYDHIHENYSAPDFDGQSYFLACIHRNRQIIDIYEWQYDRQQEKHLSRQLIRLKNETPFEHSLFTVARYKGVYIYCTKRNIMHKHNATTLKYLTPSYPLVSSLQIDTVPKIFADQYITFQDNNNVLKIYKLNNNSTLDFTFSSESVIDYFINKSSSQILLINSRNILSIYSLISSKMLWTTEQFQNATIHIHSYQIFFIIICSTTKQIYQINTNSFEFKPILTFSIDYLLSTIVEDQQSLYIVSSDQRNIVEVNIGNQKLTDPSTIKLNSSSNINQMYSVYDHLLFHCQDGSIHILKRKSREINQLEYASRVICKQNRIVLLSTDKKTLILYDLKDNLRGVINLNEDSGECQTMELNENNNDEQYLFFITDDQFLHMHQVSNGKKMGKFYLHTDLCPSIGIISDHLVLKTGNTLCMIKILNKNSIPDRLSNEKCSIFSEVMWNQCYDKDCAWSNNLLS